MEDGKTLEGIFIDLEGEGYQVESFIIPACGVGAWHRRDRIWIIGYLSERILPDSGNSSNRTNRRTKGKEEGISGECGETRRSGVSCGTGEDVSNRHNKGLQRSKETRDPKESREKRDKQLTRCSRGREYWSTEPGLGMLVDGVSPWLVEPDIPRVATGVKDRVNKLKGLGNAIVPQVCYELFLAIEKMQNGEL